MYTVNTSKIIVYIDFIYCIMYLQVHRVFPSGLAAQEGTIERGDEVLSINGQTLKNITHSDATAILRQARTMKQAVIVVSKNKDPEGKGGANESSCSSGAESSVTGGPTLTSAQKWH